MNERRGGWAAVVVNYNGGLFLDGCLRALNQNRLRPSEIVVIDNASSDDSLKELHAWPVANVIQSYNNLGFAGGANRGVAATESALVVLLNPDVELASNFGDALMDVFDRSPKLGAAGAKLLYPESHTIQHAGGVLERPLLLTHHRGYGEEDDGRWEQAANVDFVTGGSMALRREAFNAVGGFDTAFFPAYYEDVDLCLRLRAAGWDVRYEPELTGTHFESATLGRSETYFRYFHRNRLRFALKHLDATTFWRSFLPAEIERLRGELSAVDSDSWLTASGAEAIAELASGGLAQLGSAARLMSDAPLVEAIGSLDELRIMATLPPPSGSGRKGRRGLVRRLLNRFSARAYADDIFWRQRLFNDSVVRSIQAQDALNRELVAELLMALLVSGAHPRYDQSAGDERPAADE